jgi:GTP-binding protein YchF
MLSAGIVGLPNVGKSTLFNAVTRTRKAQAANYPFCTIDPNLGVVTVPDPRLEVLAKMSHLQKVIRAAIEFVDIAGLVKGASAGEGLGNQFLSHSREVNAIVQVVRCFESGDIHHVSGTIDPVRDIEVVNTELILADLASLQKRRDRLQKEVRAGSKTAKAETAIIEKLLPHLDAGRPAITLALTDEETVIARDFFLLTSKPTLFACNVAENDLAVVARIGDPGPAGEHVGGVETYARNHFGTEAVVISAQIESDLVDLSEAEAAEYLRDLGVRKRRRHAHQGGLSPSRPAHLPNDRRKGDARLDHPPRRQGAGGARSDPLRFRARFHRRRDGTFRRSGVVRLIRQGARSR